MFSPTSGVSNKILNEAIETEYKCCLPTNCSDPHTNIMTINVFGKLIKFDRLLNFIIIISQKVSTSLTSMSIFHLI